MAKASKSTKKSQSETTETITTHTVPPVDVTVTATVNETQASQPVTKAKGKKSRVRTPNVKVLLDTDDVVREQVGGFVNFVREHAIVGLAVGFVVGQQAQGIVKQLITSFIDPAFQLFFGQSLSTRTFTLHVGKNHADFGWGGMVYVLLNLLFVLAIIYALLKIFNLDKLDKKKDN